MFSPSEKTNPPDLAARRAVPAQRLTTAARPIEGNPIPSAPMIRRRDIRVNVKNSGNYWALRQCFKYSTRYDVYLKEPNAQSRPAKDVLRSARHANEPSALGDPRVERYGRSLVFADARSSIASEAPACCGHRADVPDHGRYSASGTGRAGEARQTARHQCRRSGPYGRGLRTSRRRDAAEGASRRSQREGESSGRGGSTAGRSAPCGEEPTQSRDRPQPRSQATNGCRGRRSSSDSSVKIETRKLSTACE